MKYFATFLFIVFAYIMAVTPVKANTITVDPNHMDGWHTFTHSSGVVSFVEGPDNMPMGRGSALLDDGDETAQLQNREYSGMRLDKITKLRYSTYLPEGADQQGIYLILSVDYDNNDTVDDHLLFEPNLQNHIVGNTSLPNQGEVKYNTWQQWDALAGGWWSNSGAVDAHPDSSVKTLKQILEAKPDARIMNEGDMGGIRIAAGDYNSGTDNKGFVDAFTIAADGEKTYDFEPNKTMARMRLDGNRIIVVPIVLADFPHLKQDCDDLKIKRQYNKNKYRLTVTCRIKNDKDENEMRRKWEKDDID